MDEQKLPGGSLPAGGISAPILPEKPPFSASWREIAVAAASYILAWIYLVESDLFLGSGESWWSLVFTLGFVALAELLYWRVPRPRESWIWLGCMALILAGILLERNGVWGGWAPLFLHLAAVWWVLCRSGRLAEGQSSHLLPLDAFHGFILFPFKHFFLRIRSIFYALSQLFQKKLFGSRKSLFWSVGAAIVALLLFLRAGKLLAKADENFGALFVSLFDWFRFVSPEHFLIKLTFSLPVGAYLVGLLAGTGREDPQQIREKGSHLCHWLEGLRQVPSSVWLVLTGAFCLMYAVFFGVQSRYLFGAFTRTLPEGFIVSQYAREGFFALCRVMTLNFALLWLVTRTSRRPVRENRPALVLCLILLAESLLFAVVAFSKLALYIDCFGFTPLRLQSTWLVVVLFAGWLAAGWTLLTGKKSFRAWFAFAAVSASLLCLM